MEFTVIDKITGKEADVERIALTEEWAKGIIYCDMEGFAITDEGCLVLLDECGHFEYCDERRFEVRSSERTCTMNRFEDIFGCSECGQIAHVFTKPNYCPNCGAKVVG